MPKPNKSFLLYTDIVDYTQLPAADLFNGMVSPSYRIIRIFSRAQTDCFRRNAAKGQ